ncbi:MAG TPA: hypothetical protein VMD92_14465 [Acidobacteriaceae bacterium]|nr:hypothetical protein [Acidobacteriaceae bacterium]
MQRGEPEGAQQIVASCSAAAERGERRLSRDESAGPLQQYTFVIKHDLAQLGIHSRSQVLAGFDIAEGGGIVAQLELAQAQKSMRGSVFRIERDDSLKCGRGLCIPILIVEGGSQRPPSFGPFRIQGQRFAKQGNRFVEAVSVQRCHRAPREIVK